MTHILFVVNDICCKVYVKCDVWMTLNSFFAGTQCSTHSPNCAQWWLNMRHQTAGLPCCSSSISPPRAATLMTDRYRTHGTARNLDMVHLSTKLTNNCIFEVGVRISTLFCLNRSASCCWIRWWSPTLSLSSLTTASCYSCLTLYCRTTTTQQPCTTASSPSQP